MARLELAHGRRRCRVFSRDFVTNEAHWDAQTFRLFGFEPSGQVPTGRNWSQRCTRTTASVTARPYARGCDGEFPDSELRVLNLDGTVRHLLVRGRAERSGTGTVGQPRGRSTDITARKEAENRAANTPNGCG